MILVSKTYKNEKGFYYMGDKEKNTEANQTQSAVERKAMVHDGNGKEVHGEIIYARKTKYELPSILQEEKERQGEN